MAAKTFKVATWNVNSIRVRLEQLLNWLEYAQPDVVALQETKTVDESFPVDEIKAAGYSVVYSGQKTYNGVAMLSRKPADDVLFDIPTLDDPQRRILAATVDGVRILNLYVPNGSSLDSDKYPYKLDWLDKVTQFVDGELLSNANYLIVGDFNIAPEDRDVHDPEVWQDRVLVSKPERAAFQRLLGHGFTDTFRLFEDEPVFSWWDYRAAGFRRNRGLRIDHILASKPLAKQCVGCTIDKEPRVWDRPSDHAPVMAEFNI